MVSLARQCGTGARYDGRYRRPTGSPTPGRREPKEALESRARISRLYRSEPKLHPKLWGSLPPRREDLNGLRGVRGESSGEQAHGKCDGLSPARTIYSRCVRRYSMTNSGRPSFVGILECKLNRRRKLRRRPRSPRFEMLSYLLEPPGRFSFFEMVQMLAQTVGDSWRLWPISRQRRPTRLYVFGPDGLCLSDQDINVLRSLHLCLNQSS